jgi:hypothetical protein
MKYPGTARKEKGSIVMADTFLEVKDGRISEAIEMGGDIILLAGAPEKERWAQIEKLTKESIERHRATLENLSR